MSTDSRGAFEGREAVFGEFDFEAAVGYGLREGAARGGGEGVREWRESGERELIAV
jgi:hypothetical protein